MWDSILLACSDRSRVIPPDYRRLVLRNNWNVLPTLLVGGFVARVWRPVDGGIQATAFYRLSDEAWTGLEAKAGALVAFLADREPMASECPNGQSSAGGLVLMSGASRDTSRNPTL
jgi:hypothetical protein